jgi:branched-chain amino acid transport system permease protein
MFTGPPFIYWGVIITQETLWVIAGSLVIAVGCVVLFRYGKLGRGMRAMAASVRGAQICGYSVDQVYMVAWCLGGALAGLAGVFVAPIAGVSVELSIAVITAGFVAGVLGGFDSLKGAILGGLLLGVIESLAAAYVSSALKNCVSFFLLFFVLMWRPEGLFPERVARRV